MFYHPEVLQRHRGRLGTVWLAATFSTRLQRRDYLAVDVPRACAAVSAMLTGQGGSVVPPPPRRAPAAAPPPRCSLYLAAQLQLGLARVYGRQCRYLLEEAEQVLDRLNRARPLPALDLSPPRGQQLMRGARALMVTLELDLDPFFGVMVPELPSPMTLPQVRRLLEELPPPPPEAPPSPARPPFTVPPEAITLREAEPMVLPPAFEEELPEVTMRELELLEEAEAELGVTVEEVPEEMMPPPPIAPRPPEEPSLPPEAPPAPRRRRPRLPQIDPQTQIPTERFKAQLLLPYGGCRDLVLLEPPQKRRRTPQELFQTPTCGWLPPELAELWSRCARPPPPRPAAPLVPLEPPSEAEVQLEVLEPSLPPPSSEISLEPLEEEPRPRLLPPLEERRPPPLPEAPPGRAELYRLVAAAPEGAELRTLLPRGTPRRLWARLFSLCLELCDAGWLRLEQPRPFGPILLGAGPRGALPSPAPERG